MNWNILRNKLYNNQYLYFAKYCAKFQVQYPFTVALYHLQNPKKIVAAQ